MKGKAREGLSAQYLEAAIRRFHEGYEPSNWDGLSKISQCPHGRYEYEGCSICVDEYFQSVLEGKWEPPK